TTEHVEPVTMSSYYIVNICKNWEDQEFLEKTIAYCDKIRHIFKVLQELGNMPRDRQPHNGKYKDVLNSLKASGEAKQSVCFERDSEWPDTVSFTATKPKRADLERSRVIPAFKEDKEI
ncbi:17764_t:CDS:2, partial [Gigaspora rosea]